MDLDDFRAVLRSTGVDLWALMEAAISLAARDHGGELRARRDGLVEQLYATPARCQNCFPEDRPAMKAETRERVQPRYKEEEGEMFANQERNRGASPSVMRSPDGKEEEEEGEEEDDRDWKRYSRPIKNEPSKILAIKERLDDPDQTEDSLLRMLHSLADMDIPFKVLKATDIGRHVNNLRKHPSGEVRELVKQLVRKWKDMVDEWVNSNSHETATPSIITDGDSPPQTQAENKHNRSQVSDFGYSRTYHSAQHASDTNGGLGGDRAHREVEPRAKAAPPARKEAPTKPNHPRLPSPAPPPKLVESKEHKDSLVDSARLASARRKLHEKYQEAENAKRQRTIQVMDIHDTPRRKNSFLRADQRGVPGQALVRRRV